MKQQAEIEWLNGIRNNLQSLKQEERLIALFISLSTNEASGEKQKGTNEKDNNRGAGRRDCGSNEGD